MKFQKLTRSYRRWVMLHILPNLFLIPTFSKGSTEPRVNKINDISSKAYLIFMATLSPFMMVWVQREPILIDFISYVVLQDVHIVKFIN